MEGTRESTKRQRTAEAEVERKRRKRGIRYVEPVTEKKNRRTRVKGMALARVIRIGEVLMDRLSGAHEWRDGSYGTKRKQRKEKKGDG